MAAVVCLLNLEVVLVSGALVSVPLLAGIQETRYKLMTPPNSTIAFVVLFLIITRGPGLFQWIFEMTDRIYLALGFDFETLIFFGRAYNATLGLHAPL